MSNTYIVHARDDGHRAHELKAEGFVDAAAAFVEHWLPDALQAGGEVSLVVRDAETGERHRLTIDLDTGEAEPCD